MCIRDRDKSEEIGQDAHRSGDLPVDVLAGDEHAPEPVGEDVHGATRDIRFFNPTLVERIWFYADVSLTNSTGERSCQSEYTPGNFAISRVDANGIIDES